MLEHYRNGYRATRHPSTVWPRYTFLDFLAEVFGEVQGSIERGFARLFT